MYAFFKQILIFRGVDYLTYPQTDRINPTPTLPKACINTPLPQEGVFSFYKIIGLAEKC